MAEIKLALLEDLLLSLTNIYSVSQKKTGPACIADLFNSFCKEVYAVAFFKVV